MGIGKTLSDILSEQQRNPNELADKIGESPSTIYSIIRRDNMKVDISVLAKICSELNVSMERFYNEYMDEHAKSPQLHLSAHEKDVIIAYRQHPDMQNAVDTLLNVPATQSTQTKKEA
jgi:DNA-binding Xre family transcriptional regulator